MKVYMYIVEAASNHTCRYYRLYVYVVYNVYGLILYYNFTICRHWGVCESKNQAEMAVSESSDAIVTLPYVYLLDLKSGLLVHSWLERRCQTWPAFMFIKCLPVLVARGNVWPSFLFLHFNHNYDRPNTCLSDPCLDCSRFELTYNCSYTHAHALHCFISDFKYKKVRMHRW